MIPRYLIRLDFALLACVVVFLILTRTELGLRLLFTRISALTDCGCGSGSNPLNVVVAVGDEDPVADVPYSITTLPLAPFPPEPPNAPVQVPPAPRSYFSGAATPSDCPRATAHVRIMQV